jgi:hypothetical protein
MFVPVACSQCGKPFQVPEDTIGKTTACPWCRAAVLALPIGAPAQPSEKREPTPAAPTPPAQTAPKPEVLSLDDAPPTPPRRRLVRRVLIVVMLLSLAGAVMMGTIFSLRYKQGHMYAMYPEWRAFTAPDNTFSVELLGKPKEERIETGTGGRRYVSEGWYSGTRTWVAWQPLNQVQIQLAHTKDARSDLRFLFLAEGGRLKEQFGGEPQYATLRFENPLTVEIKMEYPEGQLVSRAIVMPKDPHPRVYFIGIAGKRLNPDGDVAKHFFNSFRVNE